MVNVAVVRGECSGPPEVRVLEEGRRVASLAVRVRSEQGPATSVPVTVWQPASWVEDLAEGAEVVVVGEVRRRWFRTGAGGRGSKVEVEAAHVARAGNRRQVERALRQVEGVLDGLLG